jgi:hypothetical protein
MSDGLIHPVSLKRSHSAPHSGPSAAAIVVLLTALLLLALLLPSGGRVGIGSTDQPLRPPAGFGL